MSVAARAFHQALAPARLTEVVDIGANPIDGTPVYKPMLDLGLCRLTGFEPQPLALARLNAARGPLETYLPYAIGTGGTAELKVCKSSGMTSLLEPDSRTLALFDIIRDAGTVLERVPLQTTRLDDVTEISHIDFLKIDIQGGELDVFHSGRERLSKAVMIQTEVSFVTIYEGQPTLGDIDRELRAMGFFPHAFAELKRWPIAPALIDSDPYKALNQLLEADLVYVRDFLNGSGITDEQLKHMALIAHFAYRSIDLVWRILLMLEERGATGPEPRNRYVELLSAQ